MKHFIFLFLLGLCLSCNQNEQVDPELNNLLMSCDVKDPVNDLEWLNKIIQDLDNQPSGYRVVKLVKYDAKPYILVENIIESTPGHVYNCIGEEVTGHKGLSYSNFESRSQIIKILYEKN